MGRQPKVGDVVTHDAYGSLCFIVDQLTSSDIKLKGLRTSAMYTLSSSDFKYLQIVAGTVAVPSPSGQKFKVGDFVEETWDTSDSASIYQITATDGYSYLAFHLAHTNTFCIPGNQKDDFSLLIETPLGSISLDEIQVAVNRIKASTGRPDVDPAGNTMLDDMAAQGAFEAVASKCTCDIRDLMARGCGCKGT